MLKIVKTKDGFNVVDENGKVVNPKPFATEEEAEMFRQKMMGGGRAIEAGVPAPPEQPMPMGTQMPGPPQGLAQLLGGM